MFYRGESVRSKHHGMGVVTKPGKNPKVRFLHGLACRVPGTTLAIISHDWIDQEVEKRNRLEDWLNWRVYKMRPMRSRSLPVPKLDLASAMTETTFPTHGASVDRTDGLASSFIEYLISRGEKI